MLTHYNRIVIGCFKDFLQSVNTNNLAEVLQALKELNFMLATRAPELAAHYGMALEPHQISAEVPDLVKAYFQYNTAYNPEHSIRGIPPSRGNQYHWYNRHSSPLPYTVNNLKGQMHIFILIEITLLPIIILIVRIIYLKLLEILLIQVIIRLIL